MTIRVRLAVWYTGMLLASVIAIGVMSYYEFGVEVRARARKGWTPRDNSVRESPLFEIGEAVLWCGIPIGVLGLVGGWLLMRKALDPLRTLMQAAGRMNEGNLKERLTLSGSDDEVDRLGRVFNDMTARLDESFRRIQEFTLHASHELKTPLTIMRNELEGMLRDPNLDAAQKERVASQIDEVQRLARIVDGLSFLTKAGAGQAQFECRLLSLNELVREAFADAEVLAAARGIHVVLGECEEISVWGDRDRLRQVLLNLTDNAVKYNHPGGQVTLSVRRQGAMGVVRVANTGPGLSRELQARVFEPFFRGDRNRSEAIEGCGLGLSICRLIVKGHNGRIALESEPGALTEVAVSLPLASVEKQAPAAYGPPDP